MVRARNAAVIVVVVGLMVCPMAWAQGGADGLAAVEGRAPNVKERVDVTGAFSWLGVPTAPTNNAAASIYCERAIDIGGVFCFIGCPSGCWCIVDELYSQCCCDVSME